MIDTSILRAIKGALFIRAQNVSDPTLLQAHKDAINLVDSMLKGETVAVLWHISDVHAMTEDYEGNRSPALTDSEASSVLKAACSEHDTAIGINTDVIGFHIDQVVARRGEHHNGGDGDDD